MSKSKKLLEIIKKAVREEVRTVVREELSLALGTKKELTSEHIAHGLSLTEMSKTSKLSRKKETVKPKKRTNVEYTNNAELNKVLNETANEEWKTVNGQTYADGRSGLASAMGMGSAEQMFGGKPSAQQMLPNDRKGVQLSDEMADVLTRDYSTLLKKVDEKAGKMRP